MHFVLRLRFVLLALVAFLAIVAPGCAAPTLPLPPPQLEALSAPDASGMVEVRGAVLADALVLCFNERSEVGVIVRAESDGRFTLRIAAESDDDLSVWQQIGTDQGPQVQRTVPRPSP